MDLGRFLRNLVLVLLPVAVVWVLVTPFYNHFLSVAGENVLHLVESPDVTNLIREGKHHAVILHRNVGGGRPVYSIRLTDLHYHLVLLGSLFLAVPGVPAKERWANLGYAVLILVFFHLALVVAWTQFAYATQLGDWSARSYGPVAREVLGMAKHVLDLPVKLAAPLVLWAFFHLRRLLPEHSEEPTSSGG